MQLQIRRRRTNEVPTPPRRRRMPDELRVVKRAMRGLASGMVLEIETGDDRLTLAAIMLVDKASNEMEDSWRYWVSGNKVFAAPMRTTNRRIVKQEQEASDIASTDAFRELDEFGKLEHNWDSYDAYPIEPQAIQEAKSILFALRKAFPKEPLESLIPFDVSPVPTGGVFLEWRKPGARLLIDIGPASNYGFMEAIGERPNRKVREDHHLSESGILTEIGKFLDLK